MSDTDCVISADQAAGETEIPGDSNHDQAEPSLDNLESLLEDANKIVEKCRECGKQGNYDELIQRAVQALDTLKDIDERSSNHHLDADNTSERFKAMIAQRDKIAASIHGFMGYGLMKQGSCENALPFLEKSIDIRQAIDEPTVPRYRREAIAVENAYKLCQSKISPSNPSLIKYPRTTHLFDTGGTAITADDLVLSESDPSIAAFCNGTTRLVIEEKVDGANLGISFDPLTQDFLVQNRSHYISSGEHVQFSRISEWIEQNRAGLAQVLCTGTKKGALVLYGEWLAARHSVPYHKLPGLFVAYDIFDKDESKFYSRTRFHTTMKDSGIPVVPVIESRTFGPYSQQKRASLFRADLVSFLETQSTFRTDNGPLEGVVLRVDDGDSRWLQHKYKIVRPDFVQGCHGSHWTSYTIEKQRVDFEFALDYLTQCYPFALTNDDSESLEDNGDDAKLPIEKSSTSAQQDKSKSRVSREVKEYATQRARTRRRVPRCVMLAGLPASGKSTFASRLAASSPNEWTVVNQDKLGRKQCIALAGKASKKSKVIVDRCHPTASERQEWHDILGSPSKGECALVYFAAPVEKCIDRVQRRISHETIPYGKGERIVQCVAKTLQEPCESDERLFGTIEIVKTFEESDALLYKWGVDSDIDNK